MALDRPSSQHYQHYLPTKNVVHAIPVQLSAAPRPCRGRLAFEKQTRRDLSWRDAGPAHARVFFHAILSKAQGVETALFAVVVGRDIFVEDALERVDWDGQARRGSVGHGRAWQHWV